MSHLEKYINTIRITPHKLHFRTPARTSRSVMKDRRVYFIQGWNDQDSSKTTGLGEIAPLNGLSPEGSDFHDKINKLVHMDHPISKLKSLLDFPSFRFGLETATLDYKNGGKRHWFPGPFIKGKTSIRINGLIWMGDKNYMMKQIRQKLSDGYSCLKLKIGGIDFREELELLRYIRKEFLPLDLELRLDANGSFDPTAAEERLQRLSEFHIHSIEQPIPSGLDEDMAKLCEKNFIPIALDEELIGLKTTYEKRILLETIRPQYVIFKPSLIGGLKETKEYIELCQEIQIGWWITSALESNVGLNILAQFCDHLEVKQMQGLGTGKLFSNNIISPLREEKGKVYTDPSGQWSNFVRNPENDKPHL